MAKIHANQGLKASHLSTKLSQQYEFMVSEFKTIAKTGSIPEGSGTAIPVDGKIIAVFCENGSYFAIDDFCPHMGASLAAGHLEDGTVTCPWHAWRFRICDGIWCDNPKLGVTSYELRVEGDEIQIKVPPPKPDSDQQDSSSNNIQPSENE